ncbi:uncharacterized protein EV422DRAFT_545652 [Fimicolochytrium jonesii]|uniref:uncharacterized protein n=1 Tax=Fimicolochytrium jonesii TaxID=1396493 RepID=UPI0022FE6D29|nr:uncharacterized protein EV422DRAFT_545652 [Fimicolochytrium jonesii]KAI8816538.1 hypothetical protein EV422DRAFT_545652 [Fimicolochytrium jonesii]
MHARDVLGGEGAPAVVGRIGGEDGDEVFDEVCVGAFGAGRREPEPLGGVEVDAVGAFAGVAAFQFVGSVPFFARFVERGDAVRAGLFHWGECGGCRGRGILREHWGGIVRLRAEDGRLRHERSVARGQGCEGVRPVVNIEVRGASDLRWGGVRPCGQLELEEAQLLLVGARSPPQSTTSIRPQLAPLPRLRVRRRRIRSRERKPRRTHPLRGRKRIHLPRRRAHRSQPPELVTVWRRRGRGRHVTSLDGESRHPALPMGGQMSRVVVRDRHIASVQQEIIAFVDEQFTCVLPSSPTNTRSQTLSSGRRKWICSDVQVSGCVFPASFAKDCGVLPRYGGKRRVCAAVSFVRENSPLRRLVKKKPICA